MGSMVEVLISTENEFDSFFILSKVTFKFYICYVMSKINAVFEVQLQDLNISVQTFNISLIVIFFRIPKCYPQRKTYSMLYILFNCLFCVFTK